MSRPKNLTRNTEIGMWKSVGGTEKGKKMMDETVYQRYLSALLQGNRSQCMEVVSRLLDTDVPTETLYTDLFQRALYEIGERWEHTSPRRQRRKNI